MKRSLVVPVKSKGEQLYGKEPFFPPPVDDFIELDWWTSLEAAFVLTEWPDCELFDSYVSPKDLLSEEISGSRSSFFLPGYYPFDPKNYSKKFQEIFPAINEDVRNKKLPGRIEFLIDGIDVFVRPGDVILWALKRGLILPLDLQEVLFIKQVRERQQEPWHEKVKVMIVGQYYQLKHPGATRQQAIDSEWMKKYAYGDVRCGQDQTQIRKDLTAILSKGKPGRRGKSADTEVCQADLILIPQVLQRKGTLVECNFDLLRTVIKTAVSLVTYEIIGVELIRNMTFGEFMKAIKSDRIIGMYLDGMPQIVTFAVESAIVKMWEGIGDMIFNEGLIESLAKRFTLTNRIL